MIWQKKMFLKPKNHRALSSSTFHEYGSIDVFVCVKVLVVVLLLLWMSVSFASLFWRLFPAPVVESNELAPVNTAFEPQTTAPARSLDIAALKAIPLFGKEVAPAPVEEKEPEVVQEDVEETRLNLTLVGSFANEVDEKKAYAIIANGRAQALYRVDESLEGLNNVSLIKVFADKVILNNRGKQEALLMYPEGAAPSGSSSSVAASPFIEREAAPNTAASSTGNAAQALANLNDNQRLQKISDVIRFTRKTENGKMIGFRVLPGRNRAGFEQTGLQLNDVVTAIDGSALDNLRAANEIYKEKRNATQASLTVLRDGSELTVDIDLNSINLN